jgi:hypothetical protein
VNVLRLACTHTGIGEHSAEERFSEHGWALKRFPTPE